MAKKAAEKSAKELSEMLLNPRKNGFFKVTDEKIEKADKFCEGYKAFLNSAKTERESVEYAVAAAEKHGFVPFDPKHKYAAGDKVYYNNRGKAICLAIMGKEGCKNGVRIAAAHIDNPRLDLKPIPLYESSEMAYLKTHYYGGIKKYQWTAIPLAMHGVVVKSDGTVIRSASVKKREIRSSPSQTFCRTSVRIRLQSRWVLPLQAKTLTSSSAAARFATRRLRMHIS